MALTFDEFRTAFEDRKGQVKQKQEHEADDLPNELASSLDRLQAQTRTTYNAVQLSIRDEVNRAAAAGQSAERFSWTAVSEAILQIVDGVRVVS